MSGVLAVFALVAALVAAVVRDRRAPEALVALGAATLLVAASVIGWPDARDEADELAPTLAFLAALLVLGDGCERAGLFEWLAMWMSGAARGSPRRLLRVVVVAAAVVTAVLGLDAAVVLLTPAVLAAAMRARVHARPAVYACTHLANAGSLLLPVSNLTNLLAFHAIDVSFVRFAALMALPWLAAVAIEWLVLRRFFRDELTAPQRTGPGEPAVALPRLPLAVLGVTLAGFALSSPVGFNPVWPAVAGAVALVAPQVRRGVVSRRAVLRAIDLPLLGFVLGLGVIVRAVTDHGVGDLVDSLLPSGDRLPELLAATAVAAIAANLLNNVPALLVLLPSAAGAGPGVALAVLIGVNAGPNLTYTGSLATLLWRRVLHARGHATDIVEFSRLGALSVPPVLAGCTVALWLGLQVL